MASQLKGRIARIMRDKGFGFISAEGCDYFFHRSGLEQTTQDFEELMEGDRVAFTPIQGEKGPRAIEVRVVER